MYIYLTLTPALFVILSLWRVYRPLKFHIAIWSSVGWAMKREGGINKIRAFTRTPNSCTVKIARAPLQKKWKHAVRHTSLSYTRRKIMGLWIYFMGVSLLLFNSLFLRDFLLHHSHHIQRYRMTNFFTGTRTFQSSPQIFFSAPQYMYWAEFMSVQFHWDFWA